MIDKDVKIVTLCQVHEALEERQKPDRRKLNKGAPTDVNIDRRKKSRRGKNVETQEA
jgi:hypothetical protein